jgi:hypothetical protein
LASVNISYLTNCNLLHNISTVPFYQCELCWCSAQKVCLTVNYVGAQLTTRCVWLENAYYYLRVSFSSFYPTSKSVIYILSLKQKVPSYIKNTWNNGGNNETHFSRTWPENKYVKDTYQLPNITTSTHSTTRQGMYKLPFNTAVTHSTTGGAVVVVIVW